MKIWPAVLDLRVGGAEREHPMHLWLPVFLLWPLLAIFALLALIVTVVTDAALLVGGRPYHHYTAFVYRCFGLLADTRGMVVRVNADDNLIDMTLY
ncbi:MAG: hypothetical protein FDZ75_01225 [Actinobacteria bacterium]|nr:MAG: hypothetical protein FDZ75_01225 [Actinomycetota bacterium]